MQKLVFDTLNYAKMLENGGVLQSGIHAESLAETLSHNIYIKSEVDKMIEDVLRESSRRFDQQMRESNQRFDQQMRESKQQFAEHTHQLEKQTLKMETEMRTERAEMRAEMRAEINKTFNRHTMIIITIIGSMMALFTFIQHLIR